MNNSFSIIDNFSGGYAPLSNFFMAPILYEGIKYPTSEHAFQAAKTNDMSERNKISKLSSAKEAKQAGKKLQLIDGWDSGFKYKAMQDILLLKFTQNNGYCQEALLSTENDLLIEGNHWHDQIWGQCYCIKHTDIPGQNALGILLMYTRLKLQVRK